MAKRTYTVYSCDKDGSEEGVRQYTVSRSATRGQGKTRTVDLCKTCAEAVEEILTLKVRATSVTNLDEQ